VSADYRTIATATARVAPDRSAKSMGTVLKGAIVEGVRIESGQLVDGIDQWVVTDTGLYIHMGALEARGRAVPDPGDALAYAEADVERLKFELIKATMIRDALRGLA
jgi:hypothetical protein